MIYQEEVRKKYEIRAVVFGRDIVAIRLDSQEHPLSVLDWREPPPALVKHTPITLPTELENALLKYMELSGLVHDSFDLAVDIEGNFIFFEVNQQGQFLWMEELCPEIALLDRAVDFMRQGHPLFKYNPEKSPGIRMEDYLVDPSGFPCRENFRSRHAPDPHGYSQPD